MAASARPSPGDVRIPCPMCGGLIHPIAGKCKHCKGDIAGVRSTRPAAVAALPAIIATNHTPLNPVANGHANGHARHVNGHNGNGHASYAPMPQAAAQIAIRAYEAAPVLPPRPTGRMGTAHVARTSWWKSWPLIVIVLAVLAIVTAVVLMVWPPGKPASADTGIDTKGNKVMPAPERMETNPLPPKTQPPAKSGDPWSGAQPKTQPKIDIPDDPTAGLGGGGGGLGGGGGSLTGKSGVLMGLAHHLCNRAEACGQLDLLKTHCDTVKQFKVAPANCAAATRCFNHIDAMSCTGSFDLAGLTKLQYSVQDCVEAVAGC